MFGSCLNHVWIVFDQFCSFLHLLCLVHAGLLIEMAMGFDLPYQNSLVCLRCVQDLNVILNANLFFLVKGRLLNH